MSTQPQWNSPDPSHLKHSDLDTIRRDMWNTLFIGVASLGGFQMGWDLMESTFLPDGRPTYRRFQRNLSVSAPVNVKMTWSYVGDDLGSISIEWGSSEATTVPTVPGTCTFSYDTDGFLDTYTWS